MLFRQIPQVFDMITLNEATHKDMMNLDRYRHHPDWFESMINYSTFPLLMASEGEFLLYREDIDSEPESFEPDESLRCVKAPTGEVNIAYISDEALSVNFVPHEPTRERVSNEEAEAILANSPSPDRVTDEYLESLVVGHSYSVIGGRMTLCVMETKNGMIISGESCSADIANFNEELGRTLAFKDALNKLGAFEAYLIRERMSIRNAGT